MVHLQIVLDTRRAKADGSFSVIYRITYVKKIFTINSGFSIEKEFWDNGKKSIKKTHPNAQIINTSLSKKFYQIQKAILKTEEEGEFNYESFKNYLAGKPRSSATPTFYQFSKEVLSEFIQVNRVGNALVYSTAISRLLNHAGNHKLTFKEIDYTFLDGFRNQLLKDGLKTNSVSNYLRSIRAIYNKAIKAKIVDRSNYPFHEISIKTERTAKRAIMKDDLLKISKLVLAEDSQEWHSRNYFFLSFALIGISFTDLAYLKHEDIQKDRLTFRRRKTKKLYDIKLNDLALKLLSRYKNKHPYLLPVITEDVAEDSLKSKKVIRQWIKVTNKYLKELAAQCDIKSNLTTYVARHTWATTAKRMGYSNELIAEALGHEYGNKITNIYLDSFEQSVIDELNEKVIQGILI